MMIYLTIALASCNGQSADTEQKFTQETVTRTDSTTVTTVTIAKVRKPWYAWRGLVLGKMVKTVPQYQAIKGLDQKLYSFNENGDRFGGIYFWRHQADAENWFDPSWFEKTAKQYGEAGIVDYYKISSLIRYTSFAVQNGHYWSVLTRCDTDLGLPADTKGIIQKLNLTKADGNMYCLTVWVNKAFAEAFFKGKKLRNEYFDTPLAIVNRENQAYVLSTEK